MKYIRSLNKFIECKLQLEKKRGKYQQQQLQHQQQICQHKDQLEEQQQQELQQQHQKWQQDKQKQQKQQHQQEPKQQPQQQQYEQQHQQLFKLQLHQRPEKQQIKSRRTSNLKILYANMRGMRSKLACLKNTLCEVNVDIGLFCETFLTENKGVQIEGYTFFGRARTTGKGGGVGICVKNDKKTVISPHFTERPLELLWVSVIQFNKTPLYIGVYYGLQESVNVAKMQVEMDHLADEISEIRKEGELILCMDANAKIGLMGEEPSRNGKMIKEVFEECGIVIMNEGEKCEGVVTRQNRFKQEERSAIDFVTATYTASQSIIKVHIDEEGDFRMKNKTESDHNTIIVDVRLECIPKCQERTTKWNMNAPAEAWALFQEELRKCKNEAESIMNDKRKSMTDRYKKWDNLIQKAARKSIGKTTIKPGQAQKPTLEMQKVREERKKAKKKFESEISGIRKLEYLKEYLKKQEEVRIQAAKEEKEKMKKKFEAMIKQGPNGFWKERRRQNTDKQTSDWMIVKDDNGKRVMDQEKSKEIIASYYERLYSNGDIPHHPFHEYVNHKVQVLSQEHTSGGPIDNMPTKLEIKQAIENKKNNKATTDWKNEVIKRGGDPMIDLIYPVIKAFWDEEESPKQWNEGIITNVWKGKGDREKMENQRGITVSSSVGTIAEEIMTNRLLNTIQFTQAQAGGKKGASTTDQVFILKAIIALALKKGWELLVTFFDIKKAYDRASMDDMLYVIHEQGFKGKIWRLTKTLNENLTARVKTKAGMSREIRREKGGKQGGKLMVPMFAKMMDTLPEELSNQDSIGIKFGNLNLTCLEYVDDVSTLAIGYKQQQLTLKAVNDFAIKRQLEWGVNKCKVMEIGTHKERKKNWKLGEKVIGNCETYKYLGEEISRDGKSKMNLVERFKKVKGTVRAIMTSAKTGVMKRIETKVLLKLHDAVTLPSFLYNAESWTLNNEERKEADKIILWAWKQMLGLPTTTPTPAVIFATGSLYASIHINLKQLLYLHRLLQKGVGHWAYEALQIMRANQVGWAKRIDEVLHMWNLEEDWATIATKSRGEWKREVERASEKMNIERLKGDCHTKERGDYKQKTKTKTILQTIDNTNYQREPLKIMEYGSVLVTRAVIMGRYGMLNCKANFSSGYGGKDCATCNKVDDENHRINECIKYRAINLYERENKINFNLIYSDTVQEVLKIVELIPKLWDLGKNTMRQINEM